MVLITKSSALMEIIYYLKSIVTNKTYKKPASLFVIIALVVMLVLGAGALAFVNPHVDYHNLMLMGYAVFYIFFISIFKTFLNFSFIKFSFPTPNPGSLSNKEKSKSIKRTKHSLHSSCGRYKS